MDAGLGILEAGLGAGGGREDISISGLRSGFRRGGECGRGFVLCGGGATGFEEIGAGDFDMARGDGDTARFRASGATDLDEIGAGGFDKACEVARTGASRSSSSSDSAVKSETSSGAWFSVAVLASMVFD